VCEYELTCQSGWTLYVDDGSEGQNSCFRHTPTAVANWAAARSACPTGSHLLTMKASTWSSTGIGSAVASIFTGTLWYGCSQSSTATQKAVGWSWVDGSNAANLNCGTGNGGEGCGVWSPGEPKYVFQVALTKSLSSLCIHSRLWRLSFCVVSAAIHPTRVKDTPRCHNNCRVCVRTGNFHHVVSAGLVLLQGQRL
jgi:hypothetical protein